MFVSLPNIEAMYVVKLFKNEWTNQLVGIGSSIALVFYYHQQTAKQKNLLEANKVVA